MAFTSAAVAHDVDAHFRPGNLLVSRLVYDNNPDNVKVGTPLPPGCAADACTPAAYDDTYPLVWNNTDLDDNFGISAEIVLDQITRSGHYINSLEVPNSAERHRRRWSSQMVGSFSSKSEGALNLSTDGQHVTFMGYLAPIDALDVSNSNTPAVIDPTNPVPQAYYRVVASVDRDGHFRFTKTNAYSGDNGRAAIMDDEHHANALYMAGNAGNGDDPQPDGIVIAAGAQIAGVSHRPLHEQHPWVPTPVGSFNRTQLGDSADKIGKDTNFRGVAIYHHVLYYVKGSGSNGANAVYFVDTTGTDANGNPLACPNGTGLPSKFAHVPKRPLFYDNSVIQTKGLFPYNMCILNGFPTERKSKTFFPFAIFFANAKTLYVTDEGRGKEDYDPTTNTYPGDKDRPLAGLQKWVFDDTSGAWRLAYTLQAGLDLGVPYTVDGYATGNNPATGVPWAPATDGLRNMTGHVNRDGTVTIWAITSTVSGSGDKGADPNRLVKITDDLAATSLPAGESFETLRTARPGEVLRGVSFTPGTGDHDDDHWSFARR